MGASSMPAALPRWAETVSGTPSGNIVTPPSGLQDSGWATNQIPPAGYQDWLQWNTYKWIQYLSQVASSTTALAPAVSPPTKTATVASTVGAGYPQSLANNAQTGENGVLVAAIGTDVVYRSTDGGNSWTSIALPDSDYSVCSVFWNPIGRYFIAGGIAAVSATSPDGVTWTNRTMPVSTHWGSFALIVDQSATFGYILVAAGYAGAVAYSYDSITWVSASTGIHATGTTVCQVAGGNPNGSAAGQGIFVLTAANQSGSTSGNVLATSSDGITWTLRTAPSAYVTNAIFADFANNFYLTGGTSVFLLCDTSNNHVVTSPDGVTWTAIGNTLASDDPVPLCWNGAVAVIAGNHLMYACGDGQHVITTPLPPGLSGTSATPCVLISAQPYNYGLIFMGLTNSDADSTFFQSQQFPPLSGA